MHSKTIEARKIEIEDFIIRLVQSEEYILLQKCLKDKILKVLNLEFNFFERPQKVQDDMITM